MGLFELFLLALGLSMDAFAVSVTNGMCMKKVDTRNVLRIAITFGLFQGLMPLLGFVLGSTFASMVENIDHYIALVLLVFIGGKMIYEALSKKKEDSSCDTTATLTLAALLIQAIATSIDALVVGVSFAAMQVEILPAVAFIAVVTFICCFIGCHIGKRFGEILSSGAEIFGGVILILLGVKIFLEHMFRL